MSWIPCGNCRRTDQGRLRYAYLTTFEGDVKVQWRARYCSACFDELLVDFMGTAESHRGDGRWTAPEERV